MIFDLCCWKCGGEIIIYDRTEVDDSDECGVVAAIYFCADCGAELVVDAGMRAALTAANERERRVSALLHQRFPPGSSGPTMEDVAEAYRYVDEDADHLWRGTQ